MTIATAESSMAKKKTAAASQPDRKPIAIQIRGSVEWKAAVEKFAVTEGLPLASLVDRAIRMYARQAGYAEEFPKR